MGGKVQTCHKRWAERSMEGWRRQPDGWILPCSSGKVEREDSCGWLELETRVKFWWWFIGPVTQAGLIFLKSINSTHHDLRLPFYQHHTLLALLPAPLMLIHRWLLRTMNGLTFWLILDLPTFRETKRQWRLHSVASLPIYARKYKTSRGHEAIGL